MSARFTGRPRLCRRLVIAGVAAIALLALSVAPAAATGDFNVTVSPSSMKLPVGDSVTFSVGVASIGGFSDPVALSIGALPPGVSAVFVPQVVVPSGTSSLTLSASESAASGTFSLTVIANGGGIEKVATGQVSVDFGLVPKCTGSIEGHVIDDAGDPVDGATVVLFTSGKDPVTTQADGYYRVDGIDLGRNNEPREISLIIAYKPPTYWWSQPASTIAAADLHADGSCEPEVKTVDLKLVRIVPSTAAGRVLEGELDPTDTTRVIPKTPESPIEGAEVSVRSFGCDPLNRDCYPPPTMVTGPDGQWDLPFRVGYNNEPRHTFAQACFPVESPIDPAHSYRDGYWDSCSSEFGGGIVDLGDAVPPSAQLLDQDITLVKKCTISISGHVELPDGTPVPDVYVSAGSQTDFDRVRTDAAGSFLFDRLLLGPNNAPTQYGLDVGGTFDYPLPPGYKWVTGGPNYWVPVNGCEGRFEHTLVLTPSEPIDGAVEGYVFDEDTGEPIVGADVYLPFCPCTKTDAHGYYRLDGIHVANSDDDPRADSVTVSVFADSPAYYTVVSQVIVPANDTARHDFDLLRRRFATITGTVVDAIDGDPIEGASVSCHSGVGGFTDDQGRFVISQIPLGDRNAPTQATLCANANGYWHAETTVDVSALNTPEDPATAALELVPRCEDATISGRVVNAITHDPIENARVDGGGQTDQTDAAGNYTLGHVSVGTFNSPTEVDVRASADNFHDQTRTVTVFCGASIELNFGEPTGAIEGYVTDITGGIPGTPIGGVLIESDAGGAITDDAGYYKIPHVALGAGGTPRTWTLTASPKDFPAASKDVIVHANETARLDFQFESGSTGSLKIVKVFDPKTSGFADPFSIGYDCDDGSAHDGTATLGASQETTIGAIPTGTTCVVSETSLPSPPSGWSFGSPAIADSSGPPADGTVTIGTATSTVTVTNSISRDTGSLKIVKVFDPKTSGFADPFSIGYDCDDGSAHDGTATLGASQETTIGAIPTGTTCVVSETSLPSPPSGWSFGSPAIADSSGPPADGTVTIGTATSTVTVTNSISRDTGSLKIMKVVTGGTGSLSGTFTVDLSCANGYTNTVTLTYPSPASATLTNLPTGGCTVVETAKTPPPTGYSWGSQTISPTTVAVTKGSETVVTVTNPLVANSGAMTIGFWQNANGQTIVQSGNDPGKCQQLTDWLSGTAISSPFSSTLGPFKDASAWTACGTSSALRKGAKSTGITGYVFDVIKKASCSSADKKCNSMLKAQMLATALNVYFSDPVLGGNKIGRYSGNGSAQSPIGVMKVDLSTICKVADESVAGCVGIYTLADVLSVLGGGASSPMTVVDLLSRVATFSNSDGSIWYGSSASQQRKDQQVRAKDIFDSINNRFVIATG